MFFDVETFTPLIRCIAEKEKLSCKMIQTLKPGTNAVFRVDDAVFKIVAPIETGLDAESETKTDIFGLKRAESLGIPAPRLMADGIMQDKYLFRYIILDYIDAPVFDDAEPRFTNDRKIEIGHEMRRMTELINTPCERFNEINVIEREYRNRRWGIFPESFRRERTAFLRQYKSPQNIYVHGDLNPYNVLAGADGKLYIIDFADAVLAPPEYELPAMLLELFCFDQPYYEGYLSRGDKTEMLEQCFKGWLLMHHCGPNIITANLGKAVEITSLSVLYSRLKDKLG